MPLTGCGTRVMANVNNLIARGTCSSGTLATATCLEPSLIADALLVSILLLQAIYASVY